MKPPTLSKCTKRHFGILVAAGLAIWVLSALPLWKIRAAQPSERGAAGSTAPTNLALVAKASTSYVSGHETLAALNDGSEPRNSNDKRRGAYGNWPRSGTQWVEYEWTQPISTNKMDVYWFADGRGVRLPTACRLKYWDGKALVPVPNASGLGLAANRFNTTTFSEITTTRLRLEMDSSGTFSTGLLEWRVYDSGKSPNFPPTVAAGADRIAMVAAPTYLNGAVRDDGKVQPVPTVTWSKESGPGDVVFENANALATAARFSAQGNYGLKLTAHDGQLSASARLNVAVASPPPAEALQPVALRPYRVNSPLWSDRIKKVIMNWIPHCYAMCSNPKLREGGIENFVQAANNLAGRPAERHVGYVFSNAWVLNTVEAMCLALMVDAQGDREILAAQNAMREKLEDWIPKILAAQEPDGYLQTAYTLSGKPRWSNKHDHEGYVAGYFIEAALAHYEMTGRKDARLYNAARKLADCWCTHIGPPPKKTWYDGHQALEMALVRLGRFVNETEGANAGRKYIELAKFLMDSRRNGEEYDQSHLPVVQQYEAVGHAVRAAYSYAGMADIAIETGDLGYHNAVLSLWDNIVNKKYYVTGGIGSGETSEGFGPNYSLRNNAYCESCANCGELFFQYRMHRIHHDAKYADLYEESLYNAILGSLDLEAKNFTYTNELDTNRARYPWHACPCCVGNIARTLLMLPAWMYSTGKNAVYVNLFAGSTVSVGNVAGTALEMVQATDYPWSGKVAITVNPSAPAEFAVHIRAPQRSVSELYISTPDADGIVSLAVNGSPVSPPMENGYAVVRRMWKAGDRIDLVLPMTPQRVKASEKVAANIGRVALRYGPLVYNIESVDQNVDLVLRPDSPLATEWRPDLLGGVVVIKGMFSDGTPLTAIPNYARCNRGGRSIVWLRDQ
ncbi:MAG: glycoside hydrolase family 127 protein [Candidatus Sumerlaeia bacterium]|nr:glycoside hydrolase family 127 protein [Candidatus Sumerlaeia bacterium]